MTARYVNPTTGTDAGLGGSGAPWKTLTYAVNNAITGDTIELVGDSASIEVNWTISSTNVNGKILSIYSTPGSVFTVTMSDTTRGILQTGSAWNGATVLNISNIIFTCATIVTNGILETIGTGTGTYAMNFTGCTFRGSSNNARCWYDNHAVSTQNFSYSFTACTFNAGSFATGSAVIDAQKPFNQVTFTGCTITGGTGNVMTFGQSAGAGGNATNGITIDSCTITATGMTGSNSCFYYNETNTNRLKTLIIKNSTFNTNVSACKLQGAIKNIFVTNNVATGSAQSILFIVGSDGNTGGGNIDYAYVAGNSQTFTGTVSHGIFIGRYVQKGEICYNVSNGADYGLVVKGNTKIFAHHNVAYNVKNGAIYLRGSQDSIITDNSFYRIGAGGHGSECFGIMVDSIQDTGPVYTDPARNTFKRNLIYIADGAPTGSYFAVTENDTSHAGVTSIADHIFDYNIIRQPSGQKWAKFNSNTEYTTIANARTAWATYATVDFSNEANSQSADPLFNSPTDLGISRASPALGTVYTLYNNFGGSGIRKPKANRSVYMRTGK